MGWWGYLKDDRGHVEGEWNYTHNCNHMIHKAVESIGLVIPLDENNEPQSWWRYLRGKSGPEGASFLYQIIQEMRSHPETYHALNPPNGWGDYDSFVKLLTEMCDRVPEWPTIWHFNG